MNKNPKTIRAILWMSLLAAVFQLWFAFLEAVMVMVAIHNQHYSIYFFGFAVFGLLFTWLAIRWRKTNSEMKGLVLFLHMLFVITAVLAFLVGLFFFSFIAMMYDA